MLGGNFRKRNAIQRPWEHKSRDEAGTEMIRKPAEPNPVQQRHCIVYSMVRNSRIQLVVPNFNVHPKNLDSLRMLNGYAAVLEGCWALEAKRFGFPNIDMLVREVIEGAHFVKCALQCTVLCRDHRHVVDEGFDVNMHF